MKKHSTNYKNLLIQVAEDCSTDKAVIPPLKGDKKTVAYIQFELLRDNPYTYTSDDVLFMVHALRKEYPKQNWEAEREKFFSKGQPCFRASPLTKKYGWGIHNNEHEKIAMHPIESKEYKNLALNDDVKKKLAMRSKRK